MATAAQHESVPTTMRAWTHTSTGIPPRVLGLSPNATVPGKLSATDVLVRVSHAALNPGGSIMMQLCPMLFRAKPAIPELDFSGKIVAVGPGVPALRSLSVGSPVFGSVPVGSHIRVGVGALAEYVIVGATSVVRKPENMSFEEAAGLAVAGCVVVPLIDAANLGRGDSVLVNGASGGIGSMVVQLAKEAVGETGKVVAICSSRNLELVKSLGADEVADYEKHAPVHQYLADKFSDSRFSAVIDAYGVQDLYRHCAEFLGPGKPFVTVGIAFKEYSIPSILKAVSLMLGNILWPRLLGGVQRDYVNITGFVNLGTMEKLRQLVEEGKLRAVVDSCWDMKDVLKAYDIVLSRRAKGKVVVKIQELD